MKFSENTVFAAVLMLLFTAGCAGLMVSPSGDVNQGKVLLHEINAQGGLFPPKSVMINGHTASLYFNDKGEVVFRSGGDEPELFLDGDVPDKGNGRDPSLFEEGNHVYAAWEAKVPRTGDKLLYFRASHDGGKSFAPVKVVNSDHGVLNYAFASNGRGLLMFVYDDERNGQYQVYYNISPDYGRTWLERDVRLDVVPLSGRMKNEPRLGILAFEPKAVIEGLTILVSWKERREEGDKATYYHKTRTSVDGGKTWSDEAVVWKGDVGFITSDSPVIHNGSFYVYGYVLNKGVAMFKSSDSGKTWELMDTVAGTQSKVISQTKSVSTGDLLYAVYSSQERPSDKRRKTITHVWFAAFSYPENRWKAPIGIDRKGFDNTKTMNPDLTVLKDGTVVTAWQDNRDIFPNVYLNISRDQGKTWMDAAIAVNEPGKDSTGFPKLFLEDGVFSITYLRYLDYNNRRIDYLKREINMGKEGSITGVASAKLLSDTEKVAKLRRRVEEFWNHRLLGRFPETYKFFDPVYRSKEKQETFDRYQGNIIYHRFKIVDMEPMGNVAYVKIDYNFEIKELEIWGQKVVVEPRDDVLEEQWVWIYDNWYRVYKTTFGDQFLEY